MSPVKFYEDDRVRVLGTLVQHAPVFPALGLRFDTDDGSVVFSGDTGPTDTSSSWPKGQTCSSTRSSPGAGRSDSCPRRATKPTQNGYSGTLVVGKDLDRIGVVKR